VRVYDAADPGCYAASPSPFQICRCGAISIPSGVLASGTVGCIYSDAMETWGGCAPYDWSVVSGQLPDGLSLDASAGIVFGTPAASGAFDFVLQVSDIHENTDQETFTMVIDEYTSAKGDVNADCTVNILDVLAAVRIILGLEQPSQEQIWQADCNGAAGSCDGDGVVDILDALKMVNITLETDECP